MNLFAEALELITSPKNAALCTVVHVTGSAPQKPGAKMIVIESADPPGEIIGTIGGGAIEHFIRQQALLVIREGKSKLIETSLTIDLGMCCGGSMKVFIEPIAKRPQLICFGAGHINQALCPLACQLGFIVTIVDERKELLQNDAFSQVNAYFDDISNATLNSMPFSDTAFVVIATHDHGLDQKIVEAVLAKPFKYGALVGSERKAFMTKKRLLAKGFGDEEAARVICPAGLNIFAITPGEIALSIAAQMTLVKNETLKTLSDDSGCRDKQPVWLS